MKTKFNCPSTAKKIFGILAKYKSAVFAAIFLPLVFSLAGCDSAPNVPAAVQEQDTASARAEKILKTMTRAEKLGQMMIIGVYGTEINDDSRFMLHQYHIGNIILYDRNLETKEQVQKLTADLQKNSDGKVPLFIGLDEEGGRVVRMPQIVPPPPSAQDIGSAGDVDAARQTAEATAKELTALGCNLNFAPVADVGTDTRDYSDDPTTVGKFVTATATGYNENGIMPCLKHFPGIGKGTADTHKQAVTVTATRETLLAEDILPFRTMIDNFNHRDFMIMVGHIDYPALDEQNPASLSPTIQTELLRRELQFDGIIITDDTNMGAVAGRYTPAQIGVKAVLAGADIVMICHDYDKAAEIYLGMLDAAEKGIITDERIDESVRRILTAKLSR